jgi:hypothetical protein
MLASSHEQHEARRLRQYRIERLLSELESRRRELYRRTAGGVQPAALRDEKRELRLVRRDLAQAASIREMASPAAGTGDTAATFMSLQAVHHSARPRGRRPL